MPKKPVKLGEYEFESKQKAKDFYSSILNSADLGEILEGQNFDYVMALLLNHPNVDRKVGNGIQYIRVQTGYNSNNRCFHVVRKDNTVEDFSIRKCIDGDHSNFHKFCIAARRAVEGDLRKFKRDFFEKNGDSEGKVKCQLTGTKISFEQAHIDHREPFTFSAIVHFFIQAKDIDLDSVKYITTNIYGNEFEDQEIIKQFIQWHQENAKLRIINSKSNLQKGHLGRITTTLRDDNKAIRQTGG
jgi:hypothetical protein